MPSTRAVRAAIEQGTRAVLHVSFHYYWLDRIGHFEKYLLTSIAWRVINLFVTVLEVTFICSKLLLFTLYLLV